MSDDLREALCRTAEQGPAPVDLPDVYRRARRHRARRAAGGLAAAALVGIAGTAALSTVLDPGSDVRLTDRPPAVAPQPAETATPDARATSPGTQAPSPSPSPSPDRSAARPPAPANPSPVPSASAVPEPGVAPAPDEPVGTAGPAVGGGGVLRDGGIGDVDFGAPPLGALEELTALLGPLDAESGWERYYGECPYVSRYTAVWGPLLVRFASGTTPLADRGQEHLTAWSLVGSPDVASDPRFTTPEGIGLGATRDDLVAAYGDRLVVDGAAFQVGPVRDAGPLAGEPLLRGFLDASGRVEQLGAGLSCDA